MPIQTALITRIQGELKIGGYRKYHLRVPEEARQLGILKIKIKNLAPFYTSFFPNLGPMALFASVWDGNDMRWNDSINERMDLDKKENYELWINSSKTRKLKVKDPPKNLVLELISELSYSENSLVPFKIIINHPNIMIEEEAILYKAIPIRKSKFHLIILTHGVSGNNLDFKVVGELLNSLDNRDHKIHLLPILNNQAHTLDGIEKGGKRIVGSILSYLNHPNLEWIGKNSKISFIGHSMGGLYNRYCIGQLNSINVNGLNFFDILQPENYITFATPHLGSWESPLILDLCLKLGILRKTGRDLLPNKTNTILELLADPTQDFHQGLKRFKRLTTYANIVNDDAVGFYSSSLIFHRFNKSDFLKINPSKRNLITSIVELFTKPPEAPLIDPIVYDEMSCLESIDSDFSDETLQDRKVPAKAIAIVKNLHQGLQWRIVLTCFSYQAHSTIVVKRRFQYFHGYPVLYHMLQNHTF